MIWLIILSIFSVIFYFTAIKPFSYWKNRGVVHKKPLPIIGNSSQLILQKKSFFDYIFDLYREFYSERYFGVYQFHNPILYIKDLDLIKQITVKSFDHFCDHIQFLPEGAEQFFERNLFNLKGQRWRKMRTTLTPSFTSSKMKIIFQLLSECALEFTKHFERQNQNVCNLDMKDAFTRFTNDAIASVAFGLHCNSLEERNNEFYENGKNITSFKGLRFLILILNSICPKFVKIFQVSLFPPKENFFHSVIKETIRKREKEGLIRPDMIHLLLEARNAARPQIEQNSNDAEVHSESQLANDNSLSYLTDEDITAQALIFFIAGFESSATLMSFLSYELALNPEIQKRLRIEVDETLSNCNGKLTYEALHKMSYMDMVVSETLRKWPPLYQIDRVCTKDYTIEPVKHTEKSLLIKTGAQIMIPVVGIHRDPKYFPSPEKFDPERFSYENKDKIEPYSYLPFGLGPRICIASRFATMECKTLMFYLLTKFEIVPIEKTSIPMVLQEGAFNVNSKTGIWLGLKLRYSK